MSSLCKLDAKPQLVHSWRGQLRIRRQQQRDLCRFNYTLSSVQCAGHLTSRRHRKFWYLLGHWGHLKDRHLLNLFEQANFSRRPRSISRKEFSGGVSLIRLSLSSRAFAVKEKKTFKGKNLLSGSGCCRRPLTRPTDFRTVRHSSLPAPHSRTQPRGIAAVFRSV